MADTEKDAGKDAVDKQGESSDKAARLERLKPFQWKPGQSGNPHGRPKTITLSEAYRAALAQPVPRDPRGRCYAEKIADAMVAKAAKGDCRAAEEICNRLEGRPWQALTGPGGRPLLPETREGLGSLLRTMVEDVLGKDVVEEEMKAVETNGKL